MKSLFINLISLSFIATFINEAFFCKLHMSKKSRFKKLLRIQEESVPDKAAPVHHHHAQHASVQFTGLKHWYVKYEKVLVIIPFLLLFLAIGQIAYQTYTTGDFLSKGVSLKGGITLNIPVQQEIDVAALQHSLASQFPKLDISVRALKELGTMTGVIIEADLLEGDDAARETFLSAVGSYPGIALVPGKYTQEIVGSSLGKNFFAQTFKSLLIAFLLMSIVAFFYFGEGASIKAAVTVLGIVCSLFIFYGEGIISDGIAAVLFAVMAYLFFKHSIPSVAVIFSAFSDIVITVAIVNLIGVKVSMGGVAAFLMLIGYSVDTDILLSTRVLKKSRYAHVVDNIFDSMSTGFTMTFSTIAATFVGYFVSQSDVLKQIMLIIFIGLLVDLITTWLMNAHLLKWYVEKKERMHYGKN